MVCRRLDSGCTSAKLPDPLRVSRRVNPQGESPFGIALRKPFSRLCRGVTDVPRIGLHGGEVTYDRVDVWAKERGGSMPVECIGLPSFHGRRGVIPCHAVP